MGFDSNNNTSKPTKYLKIASEKNNKDVITGKFFGLTSKNSQGKYETHLQKNTNGYPAPFFAYLKDIRVDLTNKLKKSDGKEVPAPKVIISFVDENQENYVLDLPFTNEKGRVSSNAFSIINSFAGIDNFGYLKLYITNAKKEDGTVNFTTNVRNKSDWNPSTSSVNDFLAPKDTTAKDLTRVSWKYKYDQIPPIEIEEEVKGRKVMVNNVEEHKQFFLDIIKNDIVPKLRNVNYKFKEQSESNVTESSTKEGSITTEDNDDLPF